MWRVLAGLGAMGVVACAVEGPPEEGHNWWEGTGVGTVGSGATSGGGGAELSPPQGNPSGSSTTGSGSSDPGVGGQSTGTGDPPPPPPSGCQPDPNEPACIGCLKQACCDTLQLCQNDPACQCWEACLQQGNVAVCLGQCGLSSNLDALWSCVQNDCLSSCGW